MKATGIVRRIDDLGRVVIPKETRKILGISNGDPVEIYTEGNSVVIKKYETSDSTDRISNLIEFFTHDSNLSTVTARDVVSLLEQAKKLTE